MGSELGCIPGKPGGGGGGESESVLSPFPPLVAPRFFFCVNFFPALYYLNAWNRLVSNIWTSGTILSTAEEAWRKKIVGDNPSCKCFRPAVSRYLLSFSKKVKTSIEF